MSIIVVDEHMFLNDLHENDLISFADEVMEILADDQIEGADKLMFIRNAVERLETSK